MSVAERFILYNFLPGLVAGALSWAVVAAGIRLLDVRHGKLRLCLLTAPLLKSTLVMLGIGVVLPFPREVFATWRAGSFGPAAVLPFFLAVAGATIVGRSAFRRRARRAALRVAGSAGAGGARLRAALDEVLDAYDARRDEVVRRCGCEPAVARPDLRLVGNDLPSPLVIIDRQPTIVFPAGLVGRLSDGELRAALAHEVAHTLLRDPWSCFSSDAVRTLSVANPLAAAMATQLHREEEKACDDLAVEVLGDPDAHAAMLLNCYRFARDAARSWRAPLHYVPQLLGNKASFSERIERLLDDAAPTRGMARQGIAFAALWIVVVVLFFSG